MLHSVRIKGGKVTYCNRFVATARLAQERAAGRPLFPKLGDMLGKAGLAVLMLHKLVRSWGVAGAGRMRAGVGGRGHRGGCTSCVGQLQPLGLRPSCCC